MQAGRFRSGPAASTDQLALQTLAKQGVRSLRKRI